MAHTFRVCVVCVNTAHVCMHSCTGPQNFREHTNFVVLRRKLCHRHFDDRIHMHFHHNSDGHSAPQCKHLRTKPRQTTPIKDPQKVRGVRLAITLNYFPPQIVSPTCTTSTTLRTSTCLSPPTQCKVQKPVLSQKTPRNDSPSRRLTDEFWDWAASPSDILFLSERCQRIKFPTFLRETELWQGESANIIVQVLKRLTTKNDSLKRPLLVIDGKKKDFKPREQELPLRPFLVFFFLSCSFIFHFLNHFFTFPFFFFF